MHLCARVIEGRDAEEDVVATLAVVCLLGLSRGYERAVIVQNGLGEARCTRREVDGGVIVVADLHGGGDRGAVVHHLVVKGGVLGAGILFADKEKVGNARKLGQDGTHTLGKLGAEDQHARVGKIQAILDLVGGVAVVHGNYDRTGLQDTEVNGKPLKAVHEQNGNLVAATNATGEQEIGETVGPQIKLAPSHLAAVAITLSGLNQVKFTPSSVLLRLIGGIDLHQADFIGVKSGILFQKFCDGHGKFLRNRFDGTWVRRA